MEKVIEDNKFKASRTMAQTVAKPKRNSNTLDDIPV